MSEMAGQPYGGRNQADDDTPGEKPADGSVSAPEGGSASREAPQGPMSGGGDPGEGVHSNAGTSQAVDETDTGSAIGQAAQRQPAPGAER